MPMFSEFQARLQFLGNSADARGAVRDVHVLVAEINDEEMSAEEVSALLFISSSLIINAAVDLEDGAMMQEGAAVARRAQGPLDPHHPLYWQAEYNIANSLLSECDLGLPSGGAEVEWVPALVENRRENRAQLRRARKMLHAVGTAPAADPATRSAAFCNLANALDHIGRWAEAYDCYLRALDADASNGNAAGNLAQLLLGRIHSGVGQTGHIAAVYDKYRTLAHSLRDGTVDFAGTASAERWDALEASGSEGHLAHGLDGTGDAYRHWVAANRLALSPAVEGLGSEGAHWDSAVIEVLYGSSADEMTPPILAAMNVLKSDFLVSRKLAFEGYNDVAQGPYQKDDDSGYYIETLDYSLYGMQYSKLLLAQRSALDVLDKTAVIANEHFGIGDDPRKVSFRKFWSDAGGHPRAALIPGSARELPAHALADLAYDMEALGMYEQAQALRNAGTHRIVHAALLDATGVTVDARSRIGFLELVDSTVLALQVTRSAYLYLIDLVAAWNHPADHQGIYAPFPTLEYMHFTNDGVDDDGDQLDGDRATTESPEDA